MIQSFFPAVEPIEDALSGALLNSGPIIHSPLVVLNAGPIEHFPAWDPHNEGTTAAIRKIISILDNERMAIREAFGYASYPYPLEDHYDDTRPHEYFYPRGSRKLNVDSGKWREKLSFRHRYVAEDMAYGLAFLVSLGDYIGMPTPIARSLLTLVGAFNDIDYRKEGRTLESTGLAAMSLEDLKEFLYTGW